MSQTTLTPSVAVDVAGSSWSNESAALGYVIDGDGAEASGSGRLSLKSMDNGPGIPATDVVVGFEVELYGQTAGPILVNDTLTGTPGTWLHDHDGELNADWRRPFTGVDPSYQGFNAFGRTFYAFVNDSGATLNGSEHFLTEYAPPSADYAVEARIYSGSDGGTGERAEIYARAATPYTFYFLGYNEGIDTWELGVQTGAGTKTVLASYAGAVITPGTSRLARLEARGTSITGWIDGVQRLQATNGAITGAGYPGLRLDPGTSRTSDSSIITTALYDLGSAQVVDRVRRTLGAVNANSYAKLFEASNDGVNWVDAWIGRDFLADFGTCTFAWGAELDLADANITDTAYRYWRVACLDVDLSGGLCPPDARVSDFRLYVGGVLQEPDQVTVIARGATRTGSTPHNWAEATNSLAFSDNSPAETSTWIGGSLAAGSISTAGLQFDTFRVDRLLPSTLNVSLSADGTTPNGTAKTLLLTATNTYQLLGSPSDLWGGLWSIADVRGGDFAVLLQRSEAEAIPRIDGARVIIYHTSSGGSFSNMSLREQVRQTILIGRETTVGTSVAATVRLRHARIQPQPAAEFRDHRPAGEKLTNHQVVLKESSQGPIEGIPTYDELGWLLQGLISRPQTTVLDAGVAFRHVFAFDNRQRDPISTYTAEYGDVYSRAHKVTGMIINALTLGLRQDGIDLGGSILAQRLEDGIVMTAGAATVQTVTQSGTGTFALRFRGQETAALTAGGALTAASIQTALRALPYLAADPTQLTVTGSTGGPFTVTFGNALAGPFKGVPQPLLESRALTPTPVVSVAMTTKGGLTEFPGVPILPRHVEFFMTPTLASIASSKITEAFVTSFEMANRASPVYNLDRASTSWFAYAEPSNMEVKFSLIVHANSNGMSFLPQGRTDTTLFLRIIATGPTIGASAFPFRLQIDCPVKVGAFGPFSENQDVYAFEYGLMGVQDEANNTSLIVTLDNNVANYN